MNGKYAVLVIEGADGSLESVAGRSVVPLVAQAKVVRASGKHGKSAVASGCVLTSWNIGPVFQFRAAKQPAAVKPKG